MTKSGVLCRTMNCTATTVVELHDKRAYRSILRGRIFRHGGKGP